MKHRRTERGVALIICLFALLLLSGIGLGMMYMADTETSINRNYRDSQQAYFAALGGLQEARERFTSTSANAFTAAQKPTTLPTAGAGITTGVVYMLNWGGGVNKTDITPWTAGTAYFDDEFCHENFGPTLGPPLVTNTGANLPCDAVPTSGTPRYVDGTMPVVLGTSANLPYRWVRMTLKANRSSVPDPVAAPVKSFYVGIKTSDNTNRICWDGTRELPLPAGYFDAGGNPSCDADNPPDATSFLKSVYVLTSLAVAPGGSRRMVQIEVADSPPFVTNAALDTNNFVSVNGSSVTVNGYDNCKCVCTPAVGGAAPVCSDRTPGSCTANQTFAIFSSQTVTTAGNPALIAGTSQTGCTLPSCNPAVAQNQTFPYNVGNLIDRYKSMAGVVNITSAPYNKTCAAAPLGSTPGYANCGQLSSGIIGTLPSPWPPSDPHTPVGEINQTTYIPGSFDIQSHTTGAGVLIVDGDLTIHGGLEFYGLIIVRGVLTFAGSGSGQDLNVLGSIIAGQGSVADTVTGGVNVQYDRCALLNLQTPQPPSLLAIHEATY